MPERYSLEAAAEEAERITKQLGKKKDPTSKDHEELLPQDSGSEKSAGRPSDQDIAIVVERQMLNRETGRHLYESTKNEFMHWAEGQHDEVREEYYPGWTDGDFAKLLKKLKEGEQKNEEAADEAELITKRLGDKKDPTSKEYEEAHFSVSVERESEGRKERLERLTAAVERLFPGESRELSEMREKIIESLSVPQWGEYHNEGMFMDTHLDLILENVRDSAAGKVDAAIPADVRAVIEETSRKYGEVLERYTFLHDISKMDCLRVKYADGSVKEYTWDEWKKSLPDEAQGNPVAFKEFAKKAGIEGISYYHQSDKKTGKEGKKHGEEGADEVREIEGIDVPPAVFVAIANHEVAYQFQQPNAATYEKYFGSMTDEERALALTASYVDTVSSLGKDGKPDLRNFVALADSKRNAEVVTAVSAVLSAEKGLDAKKVEAAIKALRDRKERIAEGDEVVIARLLKECRPTEYDEAAVAMELDKLVATGAISEAEKNIVTDAVSRKDLSQLGKALGKKMQHVTKVLKASEKSS